MAKRFVDTNIWNKNWFMSLNCKQKCLVRYLFDQCDHIGIWEPNFVIASIHIGESVTEKDIQEIDGGKQFEFLDNGKVFIKDFCQFQYGELSENSRPHLVIINKLKKLGLLDRVSNTLSDRVSIPYKTKNKTKNKNKEQEPGKESEENQKPAEPEIPEPEKAPNLKTEYSELQKTFASKDLHTVGTELKAFIETKTPDFAEPYVDAWNLFSQKRGLSVVKMITDHRRDKVRIRTREPSFKFFDILNAAGKNKFYMGEDGRWKLDFDHIIDSQNNYVKILERK